MGANSEIKSLRARKIVDSRGDLSIEVVVLTNGGCTRVSAPSGASRGRWEVAPYPQRGVEEAVQMVNEKLAHAIIGMDASDQALIDKKLHEFDGTKYFTRLGGNTAYCVSLACAIGAAKSKGIHLYQRMNSSSTFSMPIPLGNVIGGGLHTRGRRIDIQELLIIPSTAKNVLQAVLANAEVHSMVGHILEESTKGPVGRGDEGAWTADLSIEEALSVVEKACDEISSSHGIRFRVGIDVAASTLWREKEGRYVYRREGLRLTDAEQLEFLMELIRRHNLLYVEDPFREDNFKAFSDLRSAAPDAMVCGDDLTVTNAKRMEMALECNSINAVIIKPNQVGTLSDALAAADKANGGGLAKVISHRSGDVPDGELAHLGVGLGCKLIKCGIVGGERISKLNELIRIEEELGGRGKMASLTV